MHDACILCQFPGRHPVFSKYEGNKPCSIFPLLIMGGLWLDKDPIYYITHRTPT